MKVAVILTLSRTKVFAVIFCLTRALVSDSLSWLSRGGVLPLGSAGMPGRKRIGERPAAAGGKEGSANTKNDTIEANMLLKTKANKSQAPERS
jgi:hypothetical protein